MKCQSQAGSWVPPLLQVWNDTEAAHREQLLSSNFVCTSVCTFKVIKCQFQLSASFTIGMGWHRGSSSWTAVGHHICLYIWTFKVTNASPSWVPRSLQVWNDTEAANSEQLSSTTFVCTSERLKWPMPSPVECHVYYRYGMTPRLLIVNNCRPPRLFVHLYV